MTNDDETMKRLCERLLVVLDENADLRTLVLDMAVRMPLTAEQAALFRAISEGRWSR